MKYWLSALLLVCAAPSLRSDVVINEVLYHSPTDLPLEFVELHNTAAVDVSLAGWRFVEGIDLAFSDDAKIPAGGYVVVASDTKLFEEFYGQPPLAVFAGRLSNKGETIALSNAKGEVVESFTYKDSKPWPRSADGKSASIERISVTSSPALAANWAPSVLSDDSGAKPAGSPGRKNAAHSDSIPPSVTFSIPSSVVAPSQSVLVSAAVKGFGAAIEKVDLLYAVAEAGKIGDEVRISMQQTADGSYGASIPGQAANRLIRVRVRASDASGAVRIEPPPYETRPAESIWVRSDDSPSKIPIIQFFNVGADEAARGKAYVDRQAQGGRGSRGGFRRPQISDRDRARMSAQGLLATGPLEQGLAALILAKGLDEDDAFETLAFFDNANSAIESLRKKLESTQDQEVEAFTKTLPDQLSAVGRKLIQQAASGLSEDHAGKVRAALEAFGSEQGGDRRGGGLARFVNIERSFFRFAMLSGIGKDQFTRLRELHRTALVSRDALERELELGADFREVFGDAREIVESLRENSEPVLTASQRDSLGGGARDARRDPRGGRGDRGDRRGGRGGRGGPFGSTPSRPLPGQGRSAFVHIDPVANTARVFDFVHITERKSGFKVRFQKDRPFDGSTTLNVLYESDERSILTEALAYELYRLAGNASAKASYARVLIDGSLAGYHLVFEQPNRSFFAKNGMRLGDLYKIIWQGSHRPSRYTPADKMPKRQDVVGRHEKKTNVHDGYANLVSLVEALEQTEDPDLMWELIEKSFDVDQVVNYFAVNTLLSHWDGFFNNYFLYQEARSGKWGMLPWDQDSTWGHRMGRSGQVFAEMPLTFGMEGDTPPGVEPNSGRDRGGRGGRGGFGFGFGRGGASWWRPGGEISKPLLANPKFRKRFLARLSVLAETVYTEEVFGPKLDALRAQLEPEVRLRAELAKRSEEDAVRQLGDTLSFFREHLVKRRRFVLDKVGSQ